MRKTQSLLLAIGAMLLLAACSGKMGALDPKYFSVTPNPLETQGGNVEATISGTFPEKYMKKKAVVTVIPELRSAIDNSTLIGQSASFQGEKVLGNDQTINYRLGGRYTMKTNFTYAPQFQQSDLYLTFNAFVGKKKVQIPAVKVATGVIATSELYKKILADGEGVIAPDAFERIKQQKQEANIKFLVNQANIRKSELQTNSIKEFIAMLKQINADRERLNMQNVEIQAYASPEGGFEFNDRLAGKRQASAEEYVKQQLKATKMDAPLDAHYTAEDWEGFQQLVQASNIQDKDVILRVLSMYKDPEQREQQIRNMSAGFRELADGILPELRRSRLIINYEVIGRSDDEIRAQYAADPSKLSIDELLYLASITEDKNTEENVYATVVRLYPNDYRALNNLASLEMAKGNQDKAKQYLGQALRLNPQAAEANANQGLLALANGNVAEAENYMAKASGQENVKGALGVLSLAKGNYAEAEKALSDTDNNMAALAQLLNKNYAAAAQTLDNIKTPNAMTNYLHAIVAARRANKFAAKSYLEEAVKLDPSMQNYADHDLELSLIK